MLLRYAVSALYSLGPRARALCRIPRNIRKGPPLCSTATARRVAPVGLYSSCSSLPRVWSPLQGYTPWALKRIAPIGVNLQAATLGTPLEAHTIAPWEELRYLGERAPTYPWVPRSQPLWREYHYPVRGTEAPWGGTYHVHLEAHTVAPWEELRYLEERAPTYPWVPRSQHLWREYHYPVRGTEAPWGHISRTLGSACCSTLGGNTTVPVDGSAIPWGRMRGSWALVLEIVFFALLATTGRVSPYRGDPSKAQGA